TAARCTCVVCRRGARRDGRTRSPCRRRGSSAAVRRCWSRWRAWRRTGAWEAPARGPANQASKPADWKGGARVASLAKEKAPPKRGPSKLRYGCSDGLFEVLGRTESDLLAGLDLDGLACGRVAAHARRPL